MKAQYPIFTTHSRLGNNYVKTFGVGTSIDVTICGDVAHPAINLHAMDSQGNLGSYIQLPEDADVLRALADELNRAADACQKSDLAFQMSSLFRILKKLVSEQAVAAEDVEGRLRDLMQDNPEATGGTQYLDPHASIEEILQAIVLEGLYNEAYEVIAEEAPFDAAWLREIAEKKLSLPRLGEAPTEATPASVVVAVMCRNPDGELDAYVTVIQASRSEQDDGFHHLRAIERAKEAGYEGPFLPFDQSRSHALVRAIGEVRKLSRA